MIKVCFDIYLYRNKLFAFNNLTLIMYDLGIIGGGPAGYTAAEHAAKLGMKVILFEEKEVGGVCLNEGCIPTKTLLYSAKLLENARNAAKYGINTENVGFDYPKIITRKNKIVRKLNAGVRAKLNHENITFVNGHASIKEKQEKNIILDHDGTDYQVRFLLICTGSHNITPPISGVDSECIWTSTEALSSKELPQKIAIIGGGVIGIEFAGFFNTLGVEVSVFEMQEEILGNTDKEISRMLREEFTKKGIKFYLDCKVLEIKENEIVFEENGTIQSMETEKILLSVGRKPNTEGLGLENVPVELTYNGGIVVDEHMESTCPNIFAAGDVIGYYMLAHTAVREAEVAVNYIRGEYDGMSHKSIPSIVYTNPEIACVGETEESLTRKNIEYKVLKLPMTFSGRFVAENEGATGLCKILVCPEGQILGVHMLGNSSSEIITLATLALEQGITAERWQKSIFPHPTVSEIIKETLNTFDPETIV